MSTEERYRYIIRPNMLDEIPYRVYGEDNFVHYYANLGDNIIQDAIQAKGYYITHGGPNCKQQKTIHREEYGEGYLGNARCLLPLQKK
jgi:hypothetical protein